MWKRIVRYRMNIDVWLVTFLQIKCKYVKLFAKKNIDTFFDLNFGRNSGDFVFKTIFLRTTYVSIVFFDTLLYVISLFIKVTLIRPLKTFLLEYRISHVYIRNCRLNINWSKMPSLDVSYLCNLYEKWINV